MKYDLPTEDPSMVNESEIIYNGTINLTNALWTLISAQAQEVQLALLNKLNMVFATDKSNTYSIKELNYRIDESEKQMECGEVISGDNVHNQMREYLNTISL